MDTKTLQTIRDGARELAEAERAQLALDLLLSLEPATPSLDVDRVWLDESKRRLAAFDASEVIADGAEDVYARALARLR